MAKNNKLNKKFLTTKNFFINMGIVISIADGIVTIQV